MHQDDVGSLLSDDKSLTKLPQLASLVFNILLVALTYIVL